MTLAEAEADKRFDQFKFCNFLVLCQYILKCELYISNNGPDAEVQEMLDAAKLIKGARMGNREENQPPTYPTGEGDI